jgi:hypothetical protein
LTSPLEGNAQLIARLFGCQELPHPGRACYTLPIEANHDILRLQARACRRAVREDF